MVVQITEMIEYSDAERRRLDPVSFLKKRIISVGSYCRGFALPFCLLWLYYTKVSAENMAASLPHSLTGAKKTQPGVHFLRSRFGYRTLYYSGYRPIHIKSIGAKFL